MISIAINVKNGEKYIERCLDALTQFEDVVLLDNYSTDATLKIAKSYSNVKIFQSEFCGMGKLRNQLATYAKYDWLFFVDSDEIVSQKLVTEILQLANSNLLKKNNIYKVLRLNYYNNFLVNGASWEKDWVSRIYNRKDTSYSEDSVHESINDKGMQVNKIATGCIHHFPYESIAELINKMQFYGTLYAKQNLAKKNPSLWFIPLRAFMAFIKFYFIKRGFKYGYEGFIISSFNALGVFTKYIKLYELNRKKKLDLTLTIDNKSELNIVINLINQQTLLPHKVFILIKNKLETTELKNLNIFIKANLIVPGSIVNYNQPQLNFACSDLLKGNPDINSQIHLENYAQLKEHDFFKCYANSILNCKLSLQQKL